MEKSTKKSTKKTTKKSSSSKTTSAPKKLETSHFAIVSLVTGIIGFLLSWMFFGWLLIIVAIVFGFLALQEIKKGEKKGHGMAVTGLVFGFTGVFVMLIILVVLFLTIGTVMASVMGEVINEIDTFDMHVLDDNVSMELDFTNPEATDIIIQNGKLVQGPDTLITT